MAEARPVVKAFTVNTRRLYLEMIETKWIEGVDVHTPVGTAHCHVSRETRRRRTRVPPLKVVPKWTLEMYGRSAGGRELPRYRTRASGILRVP